MTERAFYAALALFLVGAAGLFLARSMGRARDARGWLRFAAELVVVTWIVLPALVHRRALVVVVALTVAAVAFEIATLARASVARIIAPLLTFAVVFSAGELPSWAAAAVEALGAGTLLWEAGTALVRSPEGARPVRPRLLLFPSAAGIALVRTVLEHERGVELVLFLFAVLETGDSAAYVIGSTLGRAPLWPRVSPSKTRAGVVAALATATLVGAALMRVSPIFSWWKAALTGVVLGALGVAADLGTSAIKRRAGVKDFARYVPTHGGVFDVYDSLLVAAPLWHAWVSLR